MEMEATEAVVESEAPADLPPPASETAAPAEIAEATTGESATAEAATGEAAPDTAETDPAELEPLPELGNLEGYDESAKSATNVRESKRTPKMAADWQEFYEPAKLRKNESVADLGRDCLALHHAYGYDFSRRGNLFFIEDNRILYAATTAVVLENIVTGTREFVMSVDEGGVGAATVHPSRNYFAVGGRGMNPNVYIYSYPDLKIRRVLKGGAERGYSCMNFSADGTKLATVSMAPDYMLTIWDWEDEQMGLHSKAFGQDVWNVRFSEDDGGRLTTSGIGHIRFWKMASTFTGLKLQGHIGKFGKIDLSDIEHFVELPDGKVVSGTENGSLLLWEGNFIKCRFTLAGGQPCHKGTITFISFDRQERCVISASQDGLIKWWDYTAIDMAEVDSDHSMDFELLPLAEYSLAGGVGIKAMIDSRGVGNSRLFVAIDANGQAHTVNFTVLEDPVAARKRRRSRGQLRICDCLVTLQEKERERLEQPPAEEEGQLDMVVGDNEEFVIEKHNFGRFHAGAITGMDCCPVDHIVATCGVDGVVRCVDYVNRKELVSRSFDSPATVLRWMDTALDSTSTSFAVGFADGVVRVISIGRAINGRLALLRRLVFKPHNAAITEISFSDHCKYVATAGKDGIIFFHKCKPLGRADVVWEPMKFVNLSKLAGKTNVTCDLITWSPTEKHILASCSDGVVREIDLLPMLDYSAGMNMVDGGEDQVTFEVELPCREVQATVTVLPANKNGLYPLVRDMIVETPSAASTAPAAETAATPTAGGGGEAAASSGGGSAAMPAAVAPPESPTKASKNDFKENKPVTSVMNMKLGKAVYAKGHKATSYLCNASLSANQHMFIEGDMASPDNNHSLTLGLYAADGKDYLRPPTIMSMRYSWSRRYLILGLSDGSVVVRPVDQLEVFARTMAHNSAVQGASLVTQSFDDRFLLSASRDGMLVVHRTRLDLIQRRAEPLFKDLDAGVFGREVVKPPLSPAQLQQSPEPRYLFFVSGVHPSTEDALFDPPSTAKKPAQVIEQEIYTPDEELTDIAPGAYSIQDNRLKLEEDAKRSAAEELKSRIRASVRALRKDYEKVVKENDTIPARVRLSKEELTVDGDYFALLKKKGEAMLQEVHRECAYEAEKAEKLLEKIKQRLMKGLLVEEMPLRAFDVVTHGVSGQCVLRRQQTSLVLSLRASSLDPTVVDIIKEVKNEVHRRELQESRQRSNELAQRRAMEAMDEMKSRLLKKDDEPVAKLETNLSTAEPINPVVQESTAVQRRKNRMERKDEIAKHFQEKPNENDDDRRDLEAIRHAERTIGDYKLKCADDYEVPEEQRINVVKKVRQMAMLEESMLTMRLQFNDRFLALRQLKREIVFAVRLDNQRIRDIDEELQQEHLSLSLWEPEIDPLEFPDDYEEVTEEELQQFIQATAEKSNWKDVVAPPIRVVTGSKTSIVHNAKAGGALEVHKAGRAILPVSEDPSQLDGFLADAALMRVTPERTDPAKFYEVDERLLSSFLRPTLEAEEVKEVQSLENAVPALRFAKCLLKQRMHTSQPTSLQRKLSAQRRKELEYERSMTLKKIEDNVMSLREAVDDLRVDRHAVLADLKLAELKLLTLYQEYKLLQTFEARDTALQQKQIRCKGEETELYTLSNDNKVRLEGKQEEIQHWNDKLAQIQAEFKSLLPENHPYLDTLSKIFRKKIKRSKGGDAEDEEEEEEEEEEMDEEEDDDDEEVEDICPPGCDQVVFEKILDLREKKLDTEEVCTEIQKSIDDLKRTGERLKAREKQIAKEAQQTELEVRQFQLQKQAALNQIRIVVPLQLSQVFMFESSGCLTGPTDKPITYSEEDLARRNAFAKDPEKRVLVSNIDMKSHTLFSKKNLVRLQARITELHQEIEEAKESFSLLHKERANLLRDHESKQGETENWMARCRDLQMLKFGREIDLDDLEARSDRSKELEVEQVVAEERVKFEKELAKLMQDVSQAEERLAKATIENTKQLSEVGRLTELKMNIARELNAPAQNVQPPSAMDDYKDAEERKRITAYVKFQATELDALRTELNMLKRKEAPVFSYTVPIMPAPPMGGRALSSQQKKPDDFTLPPIPDSKRLTGK